MSSGHQNLTATLLKLFSFIQEGMCLLQRGLISLVVVSNVEMPRKLWRCHLSISRLWFPWLGISAVDEDPPDFRSFEWLLDVHYFESWEHLCSVVIILMTIWLIFTEHMSNTAFSVLYVTTHLWNLLQYAYYLYRWENQGTESLSNLLKVTQLLGARNWVSSLVLWFHSPCSWPWPHVNHFLIARLS